MRSAELSSRPQVRAGSTQSNGTDLSARTTWLLVLPFAALFFVGLVLPLGVVLWDSLALPNLSLDAYSEKLSDPVVVDALVRTFRIALVVTVVTLVLGYVLALAAWRARGHVGQLILLVVTFPLLTSLVTRNYAWTIVLGRTGPLNDVLIWSHLVDEPVNFLNTEFAVVVGMVHVLLPFAVLPVFNSLRRIDPSVLRASASVGASPVQTLRRVTLPLSAPGGVVAGVFVFVLSLGFFVTPALLGGPGKMMVANVINKEANFFLNFSGAAAIAAVLLLATVLILGLLASRLDVSRILRD